MTDFNPQEIMDDMIQRANDHEIASNLTPGLREVLIVEDIPSAAIRRSGQGVALAGGVGDMSPMTFRIGSAADRAIVDRIRERYAEHFTLKLVPVSEYHRRAAESLRRTVAELEAALSPA